MGSHNFELYERALLTVTLRKKVRWTPLKRRLKQLALTRWCRISRGVVERNLTVLTDVHLQACKFFFDVIEQPVTLFEMLHGNFFRLAHCVEVRLQANAAPTVPTQGQEILNRALLLLPARIREGFCDARLGR
jgi:hypothetical protein